MTKTDRINKIYTAEQRLALYRKAIAVYGEKECPNLYLCCLFDSVCQGINFRRLKEVEELTSPIQRKMFIMFPDAERHYSIEDNLFELRWNIRNEFLLKLIKHTENKIKNEKSS